VLAVVGTVPERLSQVLEGHVSLNQEKLFLAGQEIAVGRGTTALLAAAAKTASLLGDSPPYACLAGDIGTGEGSLKLYSHLAQKIGSWGARIIAFHYILPDVDWHNRVLLALDALEPRPLLIADAGYMYVAKMSGQAQSYDLFTPDVGELAFLADEQAPHPFYTRGFLLKEENRVPELIARAHKNEDASRWLLVKGVSDYVAAREGVLSVIQEPVVEAMEAIGGTGDTVTGMAAALIASGMEVARACEWAARANRLAGKLADPTPATQIGRIIEEIPKALEEVVRTRP